MGQFKALSQKNWILWKRNLCGNIIQVIIPIIFIFFIVAIRRLITVDTYTSQSFLSNSNYTRDYYGQQSTATAASGSVNLKNCSTGTVVSLVPSGNSFVSTINTKLTAMGYTVQQYASQSALDSVIRSQEYGYSIPKFCFGISIVEATAGSNYKYKLHFNQSTNPSNTQGPATTLKLILDEALDVQLFKKSVTSGMLGTTTFINNLILQAQTSSTNVFKNTQGPVYQQAYQKDTLYTGAKNNVAIIFLLPLLIVYLRQTSIMLSQKQKKIRQTMSIMGMKLPIYYVTWFIRYFVTLLVIHIIGSAIIARTLPHVKFIVPFIVFILFDLVIIIQSFFIQTFFSRSKLGVVIALLFFLIQYIISFISSNSDNPSLGVNNAVSIIPHCAFILSFETMLYAESIKSNITFSQTMNNYTISSCIISCIINAIVYLVLTWYLEQVFPNEFGSKKHPLWCCFGKQKKVNSQVRSQEQQSDNALKDTIAAPGPEIEEVQQKYKNMQAENKIINIHNLRKQFNDGDLVAVKNLNLKIYNDQIFVLLGHNGAGKTTTISMLTGMVEPTSGFIQVLGETDLQTIRQSIGICPQHDTLYEDLTVQQHLQLFGNFRGLSGQDLQSEVNKLIGDVNLSEKRNQYSKNLSGGQKRRLSVAMAFAGRSKVIILDEPTSGMDTSARRYIWELLKSYKSERIILLTTHFMDEADYLGDRIGIMAGGRLICCGSGHYLKNRFGVGYNITFVKKDTTVPSLPIVQTVQRHISRAVLLSDVSSQITMQLPMDEIRKFPELFNQIDSKKATLGYTTYGISITTLEQVFLKVGQQTQNAQQVRRETTHNIGYQNQNQNQKPTTTYVPGEIALKRSGQVRNHLIPIENKQLNNKSADTILFSDQKIQRIDGSCNRFLLHLKATILKRLRVIRRDYKAFILELILPMIIIILALLLMRISFIVDLPQQQITLDTYAAKASPLQIPIGSSDLTLLNNIETKITTKYGSRVTVSKDTSSTTATDFDQNFLLPKKTSVKFPIGGIFFNGQSTIGGDTVYAYTSIANTRIPTSSFYLPTLAAQSYINQIAGSNIGITIVKAPYVRTYNQLKINNTISGFFGALIFSIALGFKFASIIAFIVKERQDKSKHQQIVSGMNIAAYWFGNFIYDYVLYLVLAIFSFLMCLALGADAFTGNAFGVTVLTFFLYGIAYIPFTYILAYIFKDYGNAQAGYYFFTFVVGGLLSIVVLVLRFLGGTANTVGLVLSWIFRFIPSYCFGQILINLGSINLLSTVQLTGSQKYTPWDVKISIAPIIYLIVESFVYTLFVFLIEMMLNNQNFMRFWTSEAKVDETQQIIDSDVIAMKEKALKADPQQYQILTKNLRKVYMLDSEKKYKIAVDNLSVAIQKGQVFGLLGVNGAGKTTTFKMLAGEITSTSGDSYFTGMKISDNLRKVRQNLGYCPQFDALIQNLTVRQQIQLFYDLKSLPSELKDEMVTQKIKQMNLQQYQDKLSGTLSGGNKRKLSVAMAMIGNPNIIFLDEPSTGMDPKARRFMWKIISRIASQKKQSTIILTTHSMQQAEALSTKLGIMVNGNFKCIGTPQHIKSKYGQGYEIQIKVVPCTKNQIMNYMNQQKLQNKQTITDKQLEGFLNYLKVPVLDQAQISAKGNGNYIFNQVQSAKKIQTYQIIEYLLLVQKIKRIKSFMEAKFGGCEVIESFQTFIRFKVKALMSVGKMFESLELEKNNLQIDSYSIKQATVEQIFNRFAEDGEMSEMMG